MFAKRFYTTLQKKLFSNLVKHLYNPFTTLYAMPLGSQKDLNYNSDALRLVVDATFALKFKDARSSVY